MLFFYWQARSSTASIEKMAISTLDFSLADIFFFSNTFHLVQSIRIALVIFFTYTSVQIILLKNLISFHSLSKKSYRNFLDPSWHLLNILTFDFAFKKTGDLDNIRALHIVHWCALLHLSNKTIGGQNHLLGHNVAFFSVGWVNAGKYPP